MEKLWGLRIAALPSRQIWSGYCKLWHTTSHPKHLTACSLRHNIGFFPKLNDTSLHLVPMTVSCLELWCIFTVVFVARTGMTRGWAGATGSDHDLVLLIHMCWATGIYQRYCQKHSFLEAVLTSCRLCRTILFPGL